MGTKKTRRPEWDARGVRELRRHLGVSQQQLADELGVRQQTVSDWERGVYTPRGASRTVLRLLAERARFHYEAGRPGSRRAQPPA
jgi:DNA-binding transcriptional regulator YiaG